MLKAVEMALNGEESDTFSDVWTVERELGSLKVGENDIIYGGLSLPYRYTPEEHELILFHRQATGQMSGFDSDKFHDLFGSGALGDASLTHVPLNLNDLGDEEEVLTISSGDDARAPIKKYVLIYQKNGRS